MKRAILYLMGILVASQIMTGCTSPSEKLQNRAFLFSYPPHRCFEQLAGNAIKPASYYTCLNKVNHHCCNVCGKNQMSQSFPKHFKDESINR